MVPCCTPRRLGALSFGLFLLAASAGRCAEPRPAPDRLSPQDRDRVAEDYVRQRADVWQKRLKLQDWKIRIVMSKRIDLRGGTLGNIHWDADAKTAVIRVLNASEYNRPFEPSLQDMENTLVHEMVHLELAAMPRNDASRVAEEQAVNGMAEALLQLDRGTSH